MITPFGKNLSAVAKASQNQHNARFTNFTIVIKVKYPTLNLFSLI